MHKTNDAQTEVSDDSKERFSSDFDQLKSSFAQLREDVSKLVGNTLGTGKSGAEMLKDRAAGAVGDLKDRAADAVGDLKDRVDDGKERIHESFDRLGKKISERPLTSAAIALGIGFLLARLLHPKR
jgi:ElaB/YqjD/DUF883 family membrane-anchored ribosome-binding protein